MTPIPVAIGLYAPALPRVEARLDAEGLGLVWRPFDTEGMFDIQGSRTPATDVTLDFVWLSPDVAVHGIEAVAFDLVEACPTVRVVQTYNAGLDDPRYRRLAQRGIRICNSSAQSVAIAEYVMAQVLGLYQPLERQRELQSSETWARTPFREIADTKWLIVGFGPIGRAVAHRARAFGVHTTVIRRSPTPSDPVDRSCTLRELPEVLPEADVVILACPLNASTEGLAGRSFFAQMKPDAVLLNIARGALVDEIALLDALDSGRLARAVLDVFQTEPLPKGHALWRHPKVRVTCHTSFAGSGIMGRWDDSFVDNVARFARGEPLRHEVDPADVLSAVDLGRLRPGFQHR